MKKSYAAEIYTTYHAKPGACHGDDGKGRDPIASLLNNGIIMHSDPFSTIAAVTVRGLQPTYLDKDRNFMPMASFEDVLSDQG